MQIDWAREIERAVSDHLAADEETRRQARLFSHPSHDDSKVPIKPFHWSEAPTRRFEYIPGGGFIINLTERCAIVVSIMLLPACRIGEIPVRGDLFEHLKDPPKMGDWQDR